jgi:transcriptional regulator with GAF, ATPase, and Fis domain
MIADALARAGGVQTRAAALLGTTRRILGYRMAKFGLTNRPEK